MQELTDDQLDGLFRKSTEEFTPPFDPLAWQDMQRRLDTHEKTRLVPTPLWEHFIRWGIPMLLLLLLTGGGWYAYDKNHRGPTPARVASAPVVRSETDQQTKQSNRRTVPDQVGEPGRLPTANAVVNEPVSGNAVESATQTTLPEQVASSPKPVIKGRTQIPVVTRRMDNEKPTEKTTDGLTENADRQRPAANRRIRKSQRANDLLFADSRNRKPVVGIEYIRQNGQAELAVNSTNAPMRNLDTATTNAELMIPATTSFENLTPKPARWPNALPFVGRPVVAPAQPATETEQPARRPVVSERGLSIRFVVSPDLSAVGLRNFERPGTNIGLMAEYRLATRWSVQAGVLRSTKVYRALPSDYQLPYNYKYWPVKPESISGQCDMLDIPINLRYDVIRRADADGQVRSRWFVSAGGTSYILNREEYTYNYANPDDPAIRNTNKLIDSTSRYGFSQLNLSVGYERTINRRLSWQVEPFLKMPLKGVGFYKVNLLSTGAFFSVRYKF